MRFDPQTQKLVCRYCGAAVTAHEYKESRALHADEYTFREEKAPLRQPEATPAVTPEADEAPATYEATVMTCPQCGGQLLTTDETAATFCSFCGSSVLLESRVSKERRPDHIIPFQLTKDDCKRAYRKTLKKALYAPSDMADDAQIERFRGIYMPYWVYSFEKKGTYTTQGKKSHRKGDYIYTEHYRLTSQVDASYDGLSFDASSSFSDNLSEAIAPFEFAQAQPFSPAYLSGFYADTNDVDASVYRGDARDLAKDHAADQLYASKTIRKYDASVDNVPLRSGNPRLALYPVWFLSCRNKAGDRVSYAVVNGQTGKVAADLPIDIKKMLWGTLLLAIPIFLVLNLLLTLTPTKALVISALLGLVGMLLANRQMNLIYQLENKLDDKGYLHLVDPWKKVSRKTKTVRSSFGSGFLSVLAVMTTCFFSLWLFSTLRLPFYFIPLLVIFLIVFLPKVAAKASRRRWTITKTVVATAPMKEKMNILWKPLTGIAVSLLIVVLAPVSDLYYYGGAVVSMAFVGWSFWDILQLHNRLTTRPLPQFNKRGGEEYEHIS